MITGTRLIVAALFSAMPAFAQDSTSASLDSVRRAVEAPYRDPKKAARLGTLIPGAGHIYAGEYLQGYATYVTTVAAMVTGVVDISDKCTWPFGSGCPVPAWRSDLTGAAWIGLGTWEWVLTARDAPRAAERANERHRRHASLKPLVQIQPFNREQLLLGGELRW